MRKDELITSVVDELKEEYETNFRSKVKQCLRDINLISLEMEKLETNLKDKRKELASMEFTPFKVETTP